MPPSFSEDLISFPIFIYRSSAMKYRPTPVADSRTSVSALLPTKPEKKEITTLNLSSTSVMARRMSVAFVALFIGFTTASQAQSLLKIAKPKTVTFLGGQGEGGTYCEGVGMCRGTMMRSNDNLQAHLRTERALAAEGRFTMQDGKLLFILTNVSSANGASLTDITSLPIDRDAELPREVAREMGFTSVVVYKDRYRASMQGVFPVQAKFSTGLNAAAVPAPRGERHASVSFEVLRQMNVSAIILDANGNKVATLLNNAAIAGSETPQTLAWNGKNDAGKRMASGEYRVEIRCTLPESGTTFGETATFILAPVSVAH
jgi:hypothetical protein